jgi:hypothetical protein
MAWATAAAAATTEVFIPNPDCSPEARQALVRWLGKHADSGQVVSIQLPAINCWRSIKVPLYCPWFTQLQTLQLHNCHLRLFRDDPQGEVAQAFTEQGPDALPALQELRLTKCQVPLGTLSSLRVPQLTLLTLEETPFTLLVDKEEMTTALAALLKRLPKLRVMELLRVCAGEPLHSM